MNDESRYELVGEAYVHGMMYGEAVKDLCPEDWKDVVISDSVISRSFRGRHRWVVRLVMPYAISGPTFEKRNPQENAQLIV